MAVNTQADKKADLAGPGIGNYEDLKKILPQDYRSPLNRKETQEAIFAAKNYIEQHLCLREFNLFIDLHRITLISKGLISAFHFGPRAVFARH